MRTRWLAVITWAAAVLMACTGPATQRSTPPPAVPVPDDLLVLNSPAGLTVLDSATRATVSLGAGLPAALEPDNVVTTSPLPGATLVEARDTATGTVVGTARAPADLAPRVVSGDGWQVALMEPPPDGVDPWIPQPRTETRIVVADLADDGRLAPYRLRGNFDPEAFSTDGHSLFLLKYTPPAAPAAYTVVRLDLRRGEVRPVYGQVRTKGAPPPKAETMAGTRLSQTATADGSRLYTLYTTEAPDYAHGAGGASNPVAFVHTLDLEDGWAHCIALPEEFWGGDPAEQAMASSPGGGLLYVVDVGRDLVTVVDTTELEAIQTATVDFAPGASQAQVGVSPDGDRLFVAAGDRVVRLSTAALRPEGAWTLGAEISGLGFASDGSRLYAVTPQAVVALDPSTGRRLDRIATPSPMELVGALEN